MVQELRRVIERQGSYRFYSSSLLIIYDGAVTPKLASNKGQSVVIGREPRLIAINEVDQELRPSSDMEEDIQHEDSECSQRNGKLERECEVECDVSNLAVAEDNKVTTLPPEIRTFETSDLLHVNPTAPFRLQHHLEDDRNHLLETTPTDSTPPANLSNTTTEHDRYKLNTCCCHDNCRPHPPPPSQEQEAKLLTGGASTKHVVKNGFHSRHCNHQSFEMHCNISKVDLETARQSVDLRMIDFAHSTHRGYNDRVQYSGPDEGYVLGVSSLVACFKRMLNEST